jgi:hypothetical protein
MTICIDACFSLTRGEQSRSNKSLDDMKNRPERLGVEACRQRGILDAFARLAHSTLFLYLTEVVNQMEMFAMPVHASHNCSLINVGAALQRKLKSAAPISLCSQSLRRSLSFICVNLYLVGHSLTVRASCRIY